MIFDSILDLFRGKTITIPALDGAFRANNRLEEAALFTKLPGADNLAVLDNRVISSSGKTLYTLDEDGHATKLQDYPSEITDKVTMRLYLLPGMAPQSLFTRFVEGEVPDDRGAAVGVNTLIGYINKDISVNCQNKS